LKKWNDPAACLFFSLCYNTAVIVFAGRSMHHLSYPAETTLNWGAARRLGLAALGVLLLWGAVWWAIQ
jgi:hypothetical protein